MSFRSKYYGFGRVCTLSQSVDIPVHNNLAITPAKMAQLVDEGIPVSTSLLSGSYVDGTSNPSWDLPVDLRRGVDIAEVWNAQRSARDNIVNRVVLKSTSNE